jgi:transposase-like protein
MGRGRRFDESFKREAVAKAETSGNVTQTARELGVSGKTLYTWMKQYGERKIIDGEASPWSTSSNF